MSHMHTHLYIQLERLSSFTLSTVCALHSWDSREQLQSSPQKASAWFLNEFDMRANSRRGALLSAMNVTDNTTNEMPKCFACLPVRTGMSRARGASALKGFFSFFFNTRESSCRVKRFEIWILKRPLSFRAFEPSTSTFGALACRVSRHQSLGEEKEPNKTLVIVSL